MTIVELTFIRILTPAAAKDSPWKIRCRQVIDFRGSALTQPALQTPTQDRAELEQSLRTQTSQLRTVVREQDSDTSNHKGLT